MFNRRLLILPRRHRRPRRQCKQGHPCRRIRRTRRRSLPCRYTACCGLGSTTEFSSCSSSELVEALELAICEQSENNVAHSTVVEISSAAALKLQVPTNSGAINANQAPNTPASQAAVKPVVDATGKEIIVLRASGPSVKSQAEQNFDWNDDKEDLRQGLPPAFSVEETAARSIRLLRIIAFGGPKLRRSITTPVMLGTLSKLLLCPLHEIREDGLRLFLDSVEYFAARDSLARSHWIVPVHCLFVPDGFLSLAKLIDRTHLLQSPEFVEAGQSALAHLPAALIQILKSEGAEGLRLAMENDTTSPDMIWNQELKLFMHEQIHAQLTFFIQQLRRNNELLYPVNRSLFQSSTLN